MAITTKLDKDEQDINVDNKLYRSMIGNLLYLTASTLDIMFSVCLCARLQSCPKEFHLIAVKYIIRYLKGTIEMGLWYLKTGQFISIWFYWYLFDHSLIQCLYHIPC